MIRLPLLLLLSLLPLQSHAEFNLNFQSNPNVVSSIANQSCGSGDGGMMGGMGGMGMMGSIGPGCGSDRFLQEVISDNGTEYYHVILIDNTQDFAQEYYMRTGGCCWYSGGGMMGGMGGMGGGGDAPYSSSYGNINDRLANAWEPLSETTNSGNGSGNPGRIYMRQINNDGEMNQEYVKRFETRKPRIIQDIDSGSEQLAFDLDMSNGNYNSFSSPSSFINTFSSNQPEVPAFDMSTDAPQGDITAGRFRYSTGPNDGGSSGSFTYESADGFDPYTVDWLSYCVSSQNPDHRCNFSSGGGDGGGMMGGMGM